MAEKKRKLWIIGILLAAALLLALLFGTGVLSQAARNGNESSGPAETESPAWPDATRAPSGEIPVMRNEGDLYFPDQENWVYHFRYAYPHLLGDSYTVALINDTYQMALDEKKNLELPMFANAEEMRYDGHNEVWRDFSVMCNSDKLLSILEMRRQTQGEGAESLYLEALTFDTSGDYAGNSLTLRGVTLALAGIDSENVEDTPEALAARYRGIIDGSSTLMGEKLMPVLYEQFQALQQSGVLLASWTAEDFEQEVLPTQDFYVNGEGQILFFFQPSLMAEPSLDPPVFAFTPDELETLLTGAS